MPLDGMFFRASSRYSTSLSCDLGGSLRSKLPSDECQECCFLGGADKDSYDLETKVVVSGVHLMSRKGRLSPGLLGEKAHHLHVSRRDTSTYCQNFPQESSLDFFQHTNNCLIKSPEFCAIK